MAAKSDRRKCDPVQLADGTVESRRNYRRRLLADDPTCFYCGKPVDRRNSSLDHIVPRSLGGLTVPENLCLACTGCQERKADIPLEYLILPRVAGGCLLRVWEIPF